MSLYLFQKHIRTKNTVQLVDIRDKSSRQEIDNPIASSDQAKCIFRCCRYISLNTNVYNFIKHVETLPYTFLLCHSNYLIYD